MQSLPNSLGTAFHSQPTLKVLAMPKASKLERMTSALFNRYYFPDVCVHGEWKEAASLTKNDFYPLIPAQFSDKDKNTFLDNLLEIARFSKIGEELPFADKVFLEIFKCKVAGVVEFNFNLLCGAVGVHYCYLITFQDLKARISLDDYKFEFFKFNIPSTLASLPLKELVDQFYNYRQKQFDSSSQLCLAAAAPN